MAATLMPMDWAAEVEKQTDGLGGREETLADGIKTVVEHKQEVTTEGNNQITKTFKVTSQYRMVSKRVPKVVAMRKKWRKFGACKGAKPGVDSGTTFLGDEIKTVWICNSSGDTIMGDENAENLMAEKQSGGGAHCRYCKSKDHWSVQCPHKEQLKVNEEQDQEDEMNASMAPGSATTKDGKYVPPSQRGGNAAMMMSMDAHKRAGDDNTLRISNLPQHTEEDELKAVILEKMVEVKCQSRGVKRLFLARNKTTKECRGYAFVTFDMYSDAEKVLPVLSRAVFEHSVLQVEWSQSRV